MQDAETVMATVATVAKLRLIWFMHFAPYIKQDCDSTRSPNSNSRFVRISFAKWFCSVLIEGLRENENKCLLLVPNKLYSVAEQYF